MLRYCDGTKWACGIDVYMCQVQYADMHISYECTEFPYVSHQCFAGMFIHGTIMKTS